MSSRDPEDTPPRGTLLQIVRSLPEADARALLAGAIDKAITHSQMAEREAKLAREAADRADNFARRTVERVDAFIDLHDRAHAQLLEGQDDLQAAMMREAGASARRRDESNKLLEDNNRRIGKLETRVALLSAGGTGAVTVIAELIRGLLQ